MDPSDTSSTMKSLPSKAVQPRTVAKRSRWGRVAMCLLLSVVGWVGWKLLGPQPDLSSTIAVGEVTPDDALTDNEAPVAEGSLLSRIDKATIDAAEHPLDPLLEVAEQALQQTDETVTDYTARIVSQARLNGKLQPEQQIDCKIRHARTTGDDQCGFSVYLKFVKPDNVTGREVIWVDGWHEGKMVVHLTGWANLIRLYIDPQSSQAMQNSRYPIMDVGFRNLLVKMLEKGKQDRELGECEVNVKRNIQIEGRKCVMLEVKHPVKQDEFEFHIARIYLDQELEIPIAYEGFTWPEEQGGEPLLEEKYFYTNLKLNVDLQDIDFDPGNPAYSYPAK